MWRSVVCGLGISILMMISACSKTEPNVTAPGPQVSSSRPENPAEYKLRLDYLDVRENGRLSGEYLFRQGRTYQLLGDSSEVIIIDPDQKTLTLLDLRRHAMTALKFAEIENAINTYRRRLSEEIAFDKKQDNRASQLDAAIKAELLDPQFRIETDQNSNRVHLANTTIQVNAVGIPEPDSQRLARIVEAISLTVKLRALRTTDAIAPFAKLDTLANMTSSLKLRPSELTFLFRLTGQADKYQWKYTLVPTLTDREWEALRRIDDLMLKTKVLSFDRYERLIERVSSE